MTIDEMRSRLQADLLAARLSRRSRDAAAVAALLTALANAEAVPVADGPYEAVRGSADVPRRVLAAADIERIIDAEIEERERALAEYRRIGADAEALEAELATLERYRPAG